MKQVVVIGCGYLGSHLANYFSDKEWKVKVLGRKTTYVDILHKDINFINTNINNIDVIKNNIGEGDLIIYAAGTLNATNLFVDILPDIEENYTTFIKLLDVCVDIKINKFVFLSSAGTVYGNTSSSAKENDSLSPTNIYGLQKVYFENLLRIKHHESNGLPHLILRVSNPYGGYQNPTKKQGIIPVLINTALNDKEFNFWGDTAAIRDFIYIEDFLEATYKCISLHSNEVINIGSGVETTIGEVISIVEQRTNKQIKIVHKDLGQKTIMHNILNINKLNYLVNYYPTTTIEDGISMIISSMRKKHSG